MSRDPARSYEPLDDADLARLARLADAECDEFFSRNRHLEAWRPQRRFSALGQGAAEHYLRGARGIWDLDVLVFFAQLPGEAPKPYLRRSVRSWDWGPSKFGRCQYDPPAYEGRAVDVALWVIPDTPDPLEGPRPHLRRERPLGLGRRPRSRRPPGQSRHRDSLEEHAQPRPDNHPSTTRRGGGDGAGGLIHLPSRQPTEAPGTTDIFGDRGPTFSAIRDSLPAAV